MSLASSSCKGLVVWLILDSKKFEFFDSKTRFQEQIQFYSYKTLLQGKFRLLIFFSKNALKMVWYHVECVMRPREHSQTDPTPSGNIWNDFAKIENFKLKCDFWGLSWFFQPKCLDVGTYYLFKLRNEEFRWLRSEYMTIIIS